MAILPQPPKCWDYSIRYHSKLLIWFCFLVFFFLRVYSFYVSECMLCTVCSGWCPQRLENGVRSPGSDAIQIAVSCWVPWVWCSTDGCELLSGCWELNLSPLQEQSVHLITWFHASSISCGSLSLPLPPLISVLQHDFLDCGVGHFSNWSSVLGPGIVFIVFLFVCIFSFIRDSVIDMIVFVTTILDWFV